MLEPRLLRTHMMLGDEGISKIKEAFVVIVGLGAVGSYATEALSRAGVGKMRIVDFDEVCPTNINRQIFALHSTVGLKKTDVAQKRILDINPSCQIEKVDCFVHNDKLDNVLAGNPDLVIDAIDSLNPKVELILETTARNIPILSSMGAALRCDPSQISIGHLDQINSCPLARIVRKRLRRRGGTTAFPCVYSKEQTKKNAMQPGNADSTSMQNGSKGRIRNILGSLPTITGIFGLTIANEALSMITENFATNKLPD